MAAGAQVLREPVQSSGRCHRPHPHPPVHGQPVDRGLVPGSDVRVRGQL